MPVWPGSVFSALIMQAVSEEACERGGSTVKGLSVRAGGGAGAAKRGGLAFVIKPRTDPAYPREAVGNRRGDGCVRMSGLTEPLTNKLMKQCGNTVGRDEP